MHPDTKQKKVLLLDENFGGNSKTTTRVEEKKHLNFAFFNFCFRFPVLVHYGCLTALNCTYFMRRCFCQIRLIIRKCLPFVMKPALSFGEQRESSKLNKIKFFIVLNCFALFE